MRIKRGIVEYFNKDKFFGFIKIQDGKVYFHGSNLLVKPHPSPGDWMSFEVKQGRKTLEAVRIKYVVPQ